MGNGEFEGQSLESLHAMLAGSDPAKLANAGNALSDAAPKITEIGNYLRSHASRVEWRGEGADTFREWAHGFALEVARLGQFTGAVGNHMVNAGQALTEAKAAVPKPVDAEKAHGDPDADKAHIADGTTKLQQAIHQMERLSSYYRAAKEDIGAEREPEFKPLAIRDSGVELEARPYEERQGAPTSASPASRGSVAGALSQPNSDNAASNNAVAPANGEGVRGKTGSQDISLGIDGAHRLPQSSREVVQNVPPVGGPQGESPSIPPSTTVPANHSLGKAPPTPSRPPGWRPPSGPSIGTVADRQPPQGQGLPAISGGRNRNPQTAPGGPRLPHGLVVGEERAPFSRTPSLGGSSEPGRVSPIREAPAGGRRVYEPGGPVGGPTAHESGNPARSQRAPAVGGESHAPARGALPGAMGGMPSGNPGGVRGVSSARDGAGLAVEPGGVAANRRTDAHRNGVGFTPGGAGLIRGPEQRSPRASRRQRADLPGEPDQWPLGRDTVPPVVE